jgi:hypothetical protein
VISGPLTESPGKSSGTLARQSVSQANRDLAGRGSAGLNHQGFVLVLGGE